MALLPNSPESSFPIDRDMQGLALNVELKSADLKLCTAFDGMLSTPPSGGWGAGCVLPFCILKESVKPDFAVEERFVFVQ